VVSTIAPVTDPLLSEIWNALNGPLRIVTPRA
jgi:hypothetical protein